jgi:hypothetical protein
MGRGNLFQSHAGSSLASSPLPLNSRDDHDDDDDDEEELN